MLAARAPEPLSESVCTRCLSCIGAKPGLCTRGICFRSQGFTLRGYLIVPVGRPTTQLPPVVILSHGFSATQHMGLLDTARALCSRTGCAALTFDHGGFGESDGERHYFCHWSQATGYLDAVSYLMQAEAAVVDVARIVLWGDSLSARLALVAAAVEPLVKAVILVTLPCGRQVSEWTPADPPPSAAAKTAPGACSSDPDEQSSVIAAAGTLAALPDRARRDRCESGASTCSDISSTSEAGMMHLMDHNSVFMQMKAQLTCMRARAARIDDLEHGTTGGATIPAIEETFTLKVSQRPPVEREGARILIPLATPRR